MKENNKNLILRLISSFGQISRAQIKKLTKLSATTVSALAEELIEDGLIVEKGTLATGQSGRKPIMLTLVSKGAAFVCVEMRAASISFDVLDLYCKNLFHSEIPVSDFSEIGSLIAKSLNEIIADANARESLLAVVVAVSGVISKDKMRIEHSTVVDIDSANNFMEVIKETLGVIPVMLVNASCLAAYAEIKSPDFSSVNNLISIDIDSGVGAGIVLGGNIYSGSGLAGEFGHLSIDYKGRKCKCGNLGCLELYASIPAMLSEWEGKTFDSFKEAYLKGDKAALAIADLSQSALACGIVSLINVIDPDVIVISGKITALGDEFLNSLNKRVKSRVLSPGQRDIPISYSKISKNPVALGGAKYAFDQVFPEN